MKVLFNVFNPTEGAEKTINASLDSIHMIIFYIQSSSLTRQTFIFPPSLITTSNSSCFPDLHFAGYRIYLKVSRVSATKIKFSELSTGGAVNWTNVGLGALYI